MVEIADDYKAILSGKSWWTEDFLRRPVFLTYSFETAPYDYLKARGHSQAYSNSFRPFNDAEKAAALDALNQWDAASGIVFLQAPAGQGDIRFANYDLSLAPAPQNAVGYAYYPATSPDYSHNTPHSEDYGGDVYISSAAMRAPPEKLTHLLLHEIGHAIGLKHPFEGPFVLSSSFDKDAYTVMSYNGTSPKLGTFDIPAVQSLYGTDAQDGHQVAAWSWNAATATLTQVGGAGSDNIRGVASADIIRGGSGNDVLFGSGGGDVLDGGAAKDTIFGGNGADEAKGGDRNDTIRGEEGDDILSGEAGFDELYGGSGDDILIGGAKNDYLDGGAGKDTADYSKAHTSVTIAFSPFPDDAHILHTSSDARRDDIGKDERLRVENITGGAAADTIAGNALANVFTGNAGSDMLYGAGGSDTLIGGLGRDTLTGGAGADRFVFDAKYGGSHVKIVTDFKPGADKIVLDQDAFHGLNGVRPGLLHGAFHAGSAAHDANDRIIYDAESGRLSYDPDGLGGHGQTKIAELDAGLTLHGSDFLIVA